METFNGTICHFNIYFRSPKAIKKQRLIKFPTLPRLTSPILLDCRCCVTYLFLSSHFLHSINTFSICCTTSNSSHSQEISYKAISKNSAPWKLKSNKGFISPIGTEKAKIPFRYLCIIFWNNKK